MTKAKIGRGMKAAAEFRAYRIVLLSRQSDGTDYKGQGLLQPSK